MYIGAFVRTLGLDLVRYAELTCPTTLEEVHRLVNKVETLQQTVPGGEFYAILTEEYRRVLSICCDRGYFPRELLGIHLEHACKESFPGLQHRLLNFLSWPEKLSYRGQSQGIADFSGFLERSRECENFSDFAKILPLTSPFRQWIRRSIPEPATSGPFRHGPGATYEKLIGWDKWLALDTKPRPIMRMASVPKNRLKRRLIGIEPTLLQFCQQGAAAELRRTPYFRKWINLEDQYAHVCWAAFSTPTPVTVDMEDASDRIPTTLVEYLLPHWYPYLASISSAYAEIRHGSCKGTYRLGMMANMGCGFCFEMETLVFHIVATIVVAQETGLSPSIAARRVRVYGDDVILPETCYPAFLALCEKIGWRVNSRKTALHPSLFLETCGHYIARDSATITRRLCPSLQTVSSDGVVKALHFDTSAQKAAFSYTLDAAGFPLTARSVLGSIWDDGFLRMRYNWELYRYELRLSAMQEITRPLSVTDEIRLQAYWLSGLSSPAETEREEGTGSFREKWSWYPLSESESSLWEDAVPALRRWLLSFDEGRRPDSGPKFTSGPRRASSVVLAPGFGIVLDRRKTVR